MDLEKSQENHVVTRRALSRARDWNGTTSLVSGAPFLVPDRDHRRDHIHAWANNLLYRMTGNVRRKIRLRPAVRTGFSQDRDKNHPWKKRTLPAWTTVPRRATGSAMDHHQPAPADTRQEALTFSIDRNGGR
jgi:hypothetical protein